MVLVTKAIGLFYKIPLTSMLGGSGMSCYSGAFAVFTPVFAVAAAGIPSGLCRIVSEQLALGKYRCAVKFKSTALLIFTALSAALSAGLIIFAEPLAESAIHIPKAKWAVIAVALSLPPCAVMNVLRGWSEGLGSMTPTALSETAETLFKLIFGLLGPYAVLQYAARSFEEYHGCFGRYCTDMQEAVRVCLPFAAAASALGVSLASTVACVYLFVLTRRSGRVLADGYTGEKKPCDIKFFGRVKRLLKFTLPASVTATAATLAGMADLVAITPQLEKAMERSPQLFCHLSAYGISENERAGFIYGSYTGLALTIFGLVPTFTAMLGKSVLPSLTSAFARGDRREITKCVRSLLLLSSMIAMPGGVGIFFLSKPLLTLFFAGSHAEISVTSKPLAILGLAVVFTGLASPCLTALQACGKQLSAVFITLFSTALKLVLNIVLIGIPQINICGAAISTAVSQLVMCVLAAGLLIKASGSGAASLRAAVCPLLPSLLCGWSAFLAQRHIVMRLEGVGERLGVLISIAIGAIICVFSLGLLCISPKNQIKTLFFEKIHKTT